VRGSSPNALFGHKAVSPLQSIAVPALILAWEGDRGHPIATAEELQVLLPNAQAHIARTVSDLERWPELMRAFLLSLE
jgi:3-oxoadipate enol-lactonase